MARAAKPVGGPAWLRMADGAYAVLLRLYPRPHRDRWEEPLRQAFRDRCREVARGERGVFALLAESLPDLAAGAAREQVQLAGLAPPLRRHVAFALLLGFAATLWWHEPLAEALVASTESASHAWAGYQDARDTAAAGDFWTSLAHGLEVDAATPRQRTLAAMAWMADENPERAIAAMRTALVDGDPAAAWLAAAGCRRGTACGAMASSPDVDRALARWQREEPANAAPALFALERAAAAGDAAAVDAALDRAATATRYRAYDAALLKDLMAASDGIAVPRRLHDRFGAADASLVAGELSLAAWDRLATPRFEGLAWRCGPAARAVDDARCGAIGSLLAGSGSMMARVTGEALLLRRADADAVAGGRGELAARIADRHRLYAHARFNDPAWRAEWIRAWRSPGVHDESDALRQVRMEDGNRRVDGRCKAPGAQAGVAPDACR